MSSSLSNLANDLCDGLHNNKDINCNFFLLYRNQDDKLVFSCFECKKIYGRF